MSTTDVTVLVTARTTQYLLRFECDEELGFLEIQNRVLDRVQDAEGIKNINIFQTPEPTPLGGT